MDSIICPIIRYEVLPIWECPFIEGWNRGYCNEFTDDNIMDMRYEDSDGYVLTLGEDIGESDIESNSDDAWRCDAYKKIGPVVRKEFTIEEAERIGRMLGINWSTSKFDVVQFREGLNVELEHGRRDMLTNVTNDDPILTGKIALAHLNELPDYYTRLREIEGTAAVQRGE